MRVTEVSDVGPAPELRLSNRATQTVLLLDGEKRVGAKQNRILNLSIFAPALSDLVLPVSCVEGGRWSRAGDAFRNEGRTLCWSAFARKADPITDSLRSEGRCTSHQGEIWRGPLRGIRGKARPVPLSSQRGRRPVGKAHTE